MPLIVWSYPRGSAVKAKGGKDSFYAIDYAARVARTRMRHRQAQRAEVEQREGEALTGALFQHESVAGRDAVGDPSAPQDGRSSYSPAASGATPRRSSARRRPS